MSSKTFRLFVSSTFDDFRKEREILQAVVFPMIKEHCAEIEYIFQPIDLRWGINNEAQYRKYLSDYSYVLNFELSFLKRMKYYMKSVSNKHWGQKAVRALEGF
jgi:hypothetical protein